MKRAFLAAALVALLAAPAAFGAKRTDIPLAPGKAPTPHVPNASETYAVTVPPLPAAQAADFDADDSTFNRPLENCSALSGVGTAVRYDLVTIQNTGAASELVQVQTSDVGAPAACATLDTFVVLYRTGPFNPASPLTNCARANDDAGPGACSLLEVQVPAGQTYILVMTTFDVPPAPDAVGPYQINFNTGTTPVALQEFTVR